MSNYRYSLLREPYTGITVDTIKQHFSQTIFWNYLVDWPGDSRKEPDLELVWQEVDFICAQTLTTRASARRCKQH